MAEKCPGDVDGASHPVVSGWRGLSGTFKPSGLRRRSDVVTGLACTSRDRQSYGYVYNRGEVPDDLAIVLLRDSAPGAGTAPRGRGGGTPAVPPGSARRGARGAVRPASARAPRRSAPRRRQGEARHGRRVTRAVRAPAPPPPRACRSPEGVESLGSGSPGPTSGTGGGRNRPHNTAQWRAPAG
jgi:hypothetical protein